MPLFALEPLPVRLDDPDWEASSHRGPRYASAPDQATARMLAAAEFFVAVRPSPGEPLRRPPWDQPRLVAIAPTIGTGRAVPPEGTVLVPGTPRSPSAARMAAGLLALFGDAVEVSVAMRIDELAEAGDAKGAAWWRAVLAAIDECRRAPAPGERRH